MAFDAMLPSLSSLNFTISSNFDDVLETLGSASLVLQTNQIAKLRFYREWLQNDVDRLRADLRSVVQITGIWRRSRSDSEFWSAEFDRLVAQAQQLRHLSVSKLRFALSVAKFDTWHACLILAAAMKAAIAAEIEYLTGRVKKTTIVLTALVKLASLLRSARRIVSIQRRWFLHHGSHPIETPQFVA